MTFHKLAYIQSFLRSAADQQFVKKAMLGRMVAGAGKMVWNQAVKHQGALAPLAIAGGGLGLYSAGKAGIAKSQENMTGFDPRVIAAKREMGV